MFVYNEDRLYFFRSVLTHYMLNRAVTFGDFGEYGNGHNSFKVDTRKRISESFNSHRNLQHSFTTLLQQICAKLKT